jgi:AmpD protein
MFTRVPPDLIPRGERIDPVTHRLVDVPFMDSPHFDVRPGGLQDIDTLVIHAIALPPDTFDTPWIDHLFCGTLDCDADPYFDQLRGLRVSSHLCIFRDGRCHQYVAFDQRAWHAGRSWFDGRPDVNDFSIGIEMEGGDAHAFTDAQYARLVMVTRALASHYPKLMPERIVGHADIAPGRKTDPGPHFDWQRYLSALEFGR